MAATNNESCPVSDWRSYDQTQDFTTTTQIKNKLIEVLPKHFSTLLWEQTVSSLEMKRGTFRQQ